MPLLSMAVPFTRSEIYLLPTPVNINNPASQNGTQRNNTNTIIKAIELMVLCISLLLFNLGISEMTNQPSDATICIIFGICLAFPLLVLSGATNQNSKSLIICNYLVCFLLVAVGIISTISWMTFTAYVNSISDTLTPEIILNSQYCIKMKFMAGVLSFFNGLVYGTESLLMKFKISYNNAI